MIESTQTYMRQNKSDGKVILLEREGGQFCKDRDGVAKYSPSLYSALSESSE